MTHASVDAAAKMNVAALVSGAPSSGVIAVETTSRWKVGVVLKATAATPTQQQPGTPATVTLLVAFTEQCVQTMTVLCEPVRSNSFKKGGVSRYATNSENPRRWFALGVNEVPDRQSHLLSLRRAWVARLVSGASDTATAAVLVGNAPPIAALRTQEEIDERGRSVQEKRRRSAEARIHAGDERKPATIVAFGPAHTRPQCCPATGCENPAPWMRCSACGQVLMCDGCDSALQDVIAGTVIGGWTGNGVRCALKDSVIGGEGLFDPERLRKCVVAAQEQTDIIEMACAAFKAQSAALLRELRSGAKKRSMSQWMARMREQRDELEGAPTAACAEASAHARQWLHEQGVCAACVTRSDCATASLAPFSSFPARGVKCSERESAAAWRGAISMVYNARRLVRDTLRAHVPLYRDAAGAAMNVVFADGLAPGVAAVVKSCTRAVEEIDTVAMRSSGRQRPVDGSNGDVGDDDDPLAAASRYLTPGAAAVHLCATTSDGALPEFFASLSATPQQPTDEDLDVDPSVSVDVCDMRSVLVLFYPINTLVKLNPGLAAGSEQRDVVVVAVDDLLLRGDIDAIAIVFVDPLCPTAEYEAEAPVLILAAFRYLNVAAASERFAVSPLSVDETRKRDAMQEWGSAIRAVSHSSSAAPGYGSPILGVSTTPMLEHNIRSGGACGPLTPLGLDVLRGKGCLPGRFSDSDGFRNKNGLRSKTVTLLRSGALVPMLKPKVRGDTTAMRVIYPQREPEFGKPHTRRDGGGTAFRSGNVLGNSAQAFARPVIQCNDNADAAPVSLLCDVQNVAKAATALLARALALVGIPCFGDVHAQYIRETFEVATASLAEQRGDIAVTLRVRTPPPPMPRGHAQQSHPYPPHNSRTPPPPPPPPPPRGHLDAGHRGEDVAPAVR